MALAALQAVRWAARTAMLMATRNLLHDLPLTVSWAFLWGLSLVWTGLWTGWLLLSWRSFDQARRWLPWLTGAYLGYFWLDRLYLTADWWMLYNWPWRLFWHGVWVMTLWLFLRQCRSA